MILCSQQHFAKPTLYEKKDTPNYNLPHYNLLLYCPLRGKY